jgi:hypothetical protein
MRGNNHFSADLLHIHHMVKDRFHLSLGRAVSVLAAMSGLYALAGIAVAVLPPTLGWVLIGLLVAGKVVFLHALGYTELVLPALKKLRPEKAGLSSEQNLFLKETSGVSANGNGIHANGNGVHANGNGIHANGNGVHANGNGIHVNGNGVHANGNGIHANGNGVRKNGNGAAKGKPDTKSHDGDRDADSDAA